MTKMDQEVVLTLVTPEEATSGVPIPVAMTALGRTLLEIGGLAERSGVRVELVKMVTHRDALFRTTRDGVIALRLAMGERFTKDPRA